MYGVRRSRVIDRFLNDVIILDTTEATPSSLTSCTSSVFLEFLLDQVLGLFPRELPETDHVDDLGVRIEHEHIYSE